MAWGQRIGGSGSDLLNDLKTDAAGNIYAVGTFQNVMTVGSTTLTSNGGRDIYVVKYNPSGVVQWAKSFGSTTDDFAIGVAPDSAGHVTIDGYFLTNFTFGSIPLTTAGGTDILVAQLNQSDGSVVWAKAFGELGGDQGMGIGADASNNLYITGYLGTNVNTGVGTVTFAPCAPVTNNGPGLNVFLVKFNNAGSCVWAKAFQGTNFSRGNQIAVTGGGDVAITGWFNNTLNLGGSNLVATNLVDAFVAKYNTAGTHQWSKSFGDPTAPDFGYGITMDGSGNVLVVGTVQGTVDFGGGATPPTGANSSDGYVVQYASGTGAFNWVHRLTGTSSDEAFAVSTDSTNNVLVSGYYASTPFNYGGASTLSVPAGTQYAYLLKYNAAGTSLFAKFYAATSSSTGKAAGVTTSNRPVCGGYFGGTLTLPDGGTLVSAGGNDAFVNVTGP